jgi:Phage portal protein, SPP1 Gp6-like
MALEDLIPGSYQWWLAVLEHRLQKQTKDTQTYRDYYDGKHNLKFATEKFKAAFGTLLSPLHDNWCELVVSSVAERLKPVGFRWGDETEGDRDAWAMWQANHLDAEIQIAFTEALINRESYALVDPIPDPNAPEPGKFIPEITVEHPTQVVVANVPGSRWRRAAALKVWEDDYGAGFATLYLPGEIYKFQATRGLKSGLVLPAGVNIARWVQRQPPEDDTWPLRHELGVPVVPLVNRPRMLEPGASELKVVIPNQDSVNNLLANLIVASEVSAFKQRGIIGHQLKKDPITGKEIPPFDVAMDRLLVLENPKARFEEFSATDLMPYVNAIKNRVESISAQTRVPSHYFGLVSQWPSGEALRSAETALVRKATDKMVVFGEALEEIIRLAFRVRGNARGEDLSSETIWADPETRTQSELIDSLVKQKDLGVPLKILWEKAGYSQKDIARMEALIAGEEEPPTEDHLPAA